VSAATEARARQIRAYADHHAAVADFRRRRRADEQNRVNALLSELAAALAPLFGEPVCEVCPGCRHAISHGSARCPRCAAGWPIERTEQAV
jgi:hypothetical protein